MLCKSFVVATVCRVLKTYKRMYNRMYGKYEGGKYKLSFRHMCLIRSACEAWLSLKTIFNKE